MNKSIIVSVERVILKTLEELPPAFDDLYWDMADTTFKEEVFLSMIKAFDLPKDNALNLQSKIFPKNKLLRQILKEEVIECMGSYGKNYLGTSFFGTYKNEDKKSHENRD
jgi:hypothetical protein